MLKGLGGRFLRKERGGSFLMYKISVLGTCFDDTLVKTLPPTATYGQFKDAVKG